jgi:hypothetical protein
VDLVRWTRQAPPSQQPSNQHAYSRGEGAVLNNEYMRGILTRRISVLSAALSDDMHLHLHSAFMHIEHEELGRSYVNSETMIEGTPVADIPRNHFWASQDGYAWDMEELAQALSSNSGVMRNPLSRNLFSVEDVSAIVQHPFGRRLRALQLEQRELSKGLRAATIQKMQELSSTLLSDQDANQLESRRALDAFLVYVAILPKKEQEAIDQLRVPAVDSHTGQPFDCTIGESVRDAQANKICLHKTGDFIGQAARH